MTTKTQSLKITEIATPFGGTIGISLCPGSIPTNDAKDSQSKHSTARLSDDLDIIAGWNAAAIVSILEGDEVAGLSLDDFSDAVTRRFMEWHVLPNGLDSKPVMAMLFSWADFSEAMRQLLSCGQKVLIHESIGMEGAATIAAQLLIEMGALWIDAVKQAAAGLGHPPDMEDWSVRVASMKSRPLTPSITIDARQDRAVGALLGLAAGDAIGTTLEFTTKPKEPFVYDMVGGGPFQLEAGQWTDDTAMACALAESLLAFPELNPTDLMLQFVDWYRNGTYSCTGSCFDIGLTTREALERFEQTGDPLAGSPDPNKSGNGALMRLSPVAIRFWDDPINLFEAARLQTMTTHGSPECIEASLIFADMLADAIAGKPLHEILAGKTAARIKGGWNVHRDQITGSGYVVQSLQAAVWAVARTTNFRSAVLMAANLGDDADTTAAIAGQLAGAIYGASQIPEDWKRKLANRQELTRIAVQLFGQ